MTRKLCSLSCTNVSERIRQWHLLPAHDQSMRRFLQKTVLRLRIKNKRESSLVLEVINLQLDEKLAYRQPLPFIVPALYCRGCQRSGLEKYHPDIRTNNVLHDTYRLIEKTLSNGRFLLQLLLGSTDDLLDLKYKVWLGHALFYVR